MLMGRQELLLWLLFLSATSGNATFWDWPFNTANNNKALPALPRPQPTAPYRKLQESDAAEPQSVCEFFQSGRSDPTNCCQWGKYGLCDMSDADKWVRRAALRCHDCVTSHNICADPPKLTLHMYLVYLDKDNWQGNLVAMKAYLLTQDLHKTQFWLWTDHPSAIVNENTKPFFDTFADVITVRTFDWDAEIQDSPLQDDAYFGNHFQVKSDFESFPPGYSDLVRHLLLYKHGGLWVDSDAVLLRDVYPVTIQVGYQFVMRWVNSHIYFMKQRSPLGKRMLEQVRAMPFEDSDKFRDEIINKTCRPVGYYPVVEPKQFKDFYGFCPFQMVKASAENRGNDLDNILFDQPLGWWDQHWLNCPNLDTVLNETSYLHSISTAMSLHIRYPGHSGHKGPSDSQLDRTIKLIDNVFSRCKVRTCIPQHAMPLMDYMYYDNFGASHHHVHRNGLSSVRSHL